MIVISFLVLTALGAPPEATKAQDEYAAKLTTAEPTADAQYRLATWARQQGMKDVAEGHLRAAVHINPNFEAAQKSLGRTAKSGIWETKDERKDRLAREASLQAERRDWDRRLTELGVEAACAVHPLNEAGVSAVEEFSVANAERSNEAVKEFSSSSLGAATLVLIRQTLTSQFADVRRAAAKALALRNPDHVLPPLVEWVRPVRSGRTVALGVGEIWYWQQGSTMFVALPAPSRLAPLERRQPTRSQAFLVRVGPATSIGDRPNVVEDRLAEAESCRHNAVAALQTITGKKLGPEFSTWRDALMQATDTHVGERAEAPQSLSAMYYHSDAMSVGLVGVSNLLPWAASCFAAGTPVVTKRGLLPIDQVCIGELVLSRNVETDVTEYKPVLARTLRPRVPMRKLTVGDETLFSTAGHPFWTPDKGWTKAKNLSQGLSLGGEDGVVKLTNIADAEEPQQAYNLVVADFGTYFVGKSRLLVHDNTPIRDAPAKAK